MRPCECFLITLPEISDSNNTIIVNVSPLEYCHILLVPDPEKCQPQLLTEKSLNLAVQLCLLSDSSYVLHQFTSPFSLMISYPWKYFPDIFVSVSIA